MLWLSDLTCFVLRVGISGYLPFLFIILVLHFFRLWIIRLNCVKIQSFKKLMPISFAKSAKFKLVFLLCIYNRECLIFSTLHSRKLGQILHSSSPFPFVMPLFQKVMLHGKCSSKRGELVKYELLLINLFIILFGSACFSCSLQDIPP